MWLWGESHYFVGLPTSIVKIAALKRTDAIFPKLFAQFSVDNNKNPGQKPGSFSNSPGHQNILSKWPNKDRRVRKDGQIKKSFHICSSCLKLSMFYLFFRCPTKKACVAIPTQRYFSIVKTWRKNLLVSPLFAAAHHITYQAFFILFKQKNHIGKKTHFAVYYLLKKTFDFSP